ncbi:mRNA capping enzyme small subunit [Eastern grey kangaroopox virus]|uniref:mRNA capping enzyme small subunit n=1 Tax=Eastern grey kangaroopox virus TaxID=2042482 RepID=A0A2C9DT65_9POXV|nr:mRNA capping enzyme small subunit [Eastern grey kangaroopox virus]ATI21198.1 mRNA capping enzyme small subunit [Eastern grey kangaroopox virus]ATX75104.1 mRNA capping enzyme small subunit [Eastern grey kangaroopox virus]
MDADAIAAVVRSGTGVHMPFYEDLPRLDLAFGKNHIPSLEYGANYFLQLSKINDLNRMSTDMVSLYTHDLAAKESDLEHVYDMYDIKSIKSYGRSVQADAIVLDLSASNKLYKREHPFLKSNNYLKANNFYISDYAMITFEVFRPLFDLVSERFCIVKLPTLFGRGVVNAVRVYCSIFRTVKLFKFPTDSWLKDSAVMVCQNVHTANLAAFLAHVRTVTRSSVWREANNAPYVLVREPVEREFVEKFLEFSTKVNLAMYYIHTLLYNSMSSESKSLDNEHQKKLMKLLHH